VKKQLGIGIFTIVEVAGLIVWLLLALQGQPLLGLGILFTALSIEHVITFFVIQKDTPTVPRPTVPLFSILVFSVIETVIWGLWLLIAQSEVGPLFAAVFLTAALLVEHTLSDNVFRREKLFSKIVEPRTTGFTLIEVVAATGWLLLVLEGQAILGPIVMLVGSFIEHNIAVRVAQR